MDALQGRGGTRFVGGGSWIVGARRWRVASLREGPLRLDLHLEVKLHSSSLRGVARRRARSSWRLWWQCFLQSVLHPRGMPLRDVLFLFYFGTCTRLARCVRLLLALVGTFLLHFAFLPQEGELHTHRGKRDALVDGLTNEICLKVDLLPFQSVNFDFDIAGSKVELMDLEEVFI
ncbi:hypothetical protein Taro_047698 [Colocasia esculenta]|uniref:Uncharacterized protein n=1 Tax=Colocasia esculenta TaxID=4460 RepID=A0A843WW47_COLES|nr:hypothetical protein [Colocasia esculenta]